jgi:hypothetical protein
MATALAFALAFAGCKTAPKATETNAPPSETVQTTATKPVDDALTALRDRVEALRAECLKYHLDSYKSDEWALAEKSRSAGLAAYGTDYDAAKAAFEDAIARYEDIRKSSYEKIAAELDAALVAAREAAVNAGAQAYYPEQFALADSAAENSRALRTEGKDAEAYDAAQLALIRYQILTKAREAIALKAKVDQNGFVQYGPEDYALADSRYGEALASYGSADAAALAAIEESCRLYAKVNNAGFKALAEPEMQKVAEIRGLCDAIKAKKTVTDEYGKAAVLHDGAAKAASQDSWETAYNGYAAATVAFTNVYQAATLKRNAAEAAMASAKQRQTESSELARKADEVIPLPENAEGFSEDPFVIESESGGAAVDQAAPAQDTASDVAPTESASGEPSPDAEPAPAEPAPTESVSSEPAPDEAVPAEAAADDAAPNADTANGEETK